MNIIIQSIVKYIFTRLTEFSTWRGLVLVCAGTWGESHPEIMNSIVNQTFILVGLIGTMLPDHVSCLSFLRESDAEKKLDDQIREIVEQELNNQKYDPPVQVEPDIIGGFNDKTEDAPIDIINDRMPEPTRPTISQNKLSPLNTKRTDFQERDIRPKLQISIPSRRPDPTQEIPETGFNDK